MKYLSVKWKITAITVAIFLTVTGITTYLTIQSQRKMVLDSAQRHAEDLAVGYFDVLNTMMLTGTIQNRDIIRQKMERNPEIDVVRPIRSEYINQQYPGDHADEEPQDALDHRALRGEEVVEITETIKGRKLTIVKPAIARAKLPGETLACTNCHAVDEGTVLGAVRLEFSLAERDAKIQEQAMQTLGINLALILVGMALLFLFMHKVVVHPIKSLQQLMGKLESGDLMQEVPAKNKNDEIGDIGRSIDSFSSHLRQDIQDIKGHTQTLALRSEALAEVSLLLVSNATDLANQTHDTQASTQSVDHQVKGMSRSADDISNAVSDVLTAATQVATSMSDVTQSTRHVEDSITSIATSSDQMNATIQDIAKNSGNAQELTNNAVEALEQGVTRIHSLAQTTRNIEGAIFEVEEIAELTQNLALNAHIEAAKAGSAGAGFRVVAEEVRGLAKQTAHATEVIQERVSAILEVTDLVVGEMQGVNEMMGQMRDRISEVATAVEEQSVTTANNTEHIQDMVRSIKDVANHIDQAEKATKNIAQEIASVSDQATSVKASSEETQTSTQRIVESIDVVGAISDTEKQHANTVASSAKELTDTSEQLRIMIARFKVED
jgi:methyl-accepting chemotaxis protein